MERIRDDWSFIDKVCFSLCQGQVDVLDKLIKSLPPADREPTLETASRLCEHEPWGMSQEGFATGKLCAVLHGGVTFKLDDVGVAMLEYYTNIYGEYITKGMREALSDEARYLHFQQQLKQKTGHEDSQQVISQRRAVHVDYSQLKIKPNTVKAMANSHQMQFDVIEISHDSAVLHMNRKHAKVLDASEVLTFVCDSIKIQSQAMQAKRMFVENISGVVCRVVFQLLHSSTDVSSEGLNSSQTHHGDPKSYDIVSFESFFSTLSHHHDLDKPQSDTYTTELAMQLGRLFSCERLLPVLMSTHKNKLLPQIIGGVVHDQNTHLVERISPFSDLYLCQATLAKLLLRSQPNQETYYIVAKLKTGQYIVRQDNDHDVSYTIAAGLQNNSLRVFKVNVERTRRSDIDFLIKHVSTPLPKLSNDSVLHLVYFYEVELPSEGKYQQVDAGTDVQHLIRRFPMKWLRVPLLKNLSTNGRSERRYLYSTKCQVHYSLFRKAEAEVVNFSVHGLCLYLGDEFDYERLPKHKTLRLNIPALGVINGIYQQVLFDKSNQLLHLRLCDKHWRQDKTVTALEYVITNNQDRFSGNDSELRAARMYLFATLLAANYLPHLWITSHPEQEGQGSSLSCDYLLSGVVDCQMPILKKSNDLEFFKGHLFFDDFAVHEVEEWNNLAATQPFIGLVKRATGSERLGDVFERLPFDAHIFNVVTGAQLVFPPVVKKWLEAGCKTVQEVLISKNEYRYLTIVHVSYLYRHLVATYITDDCDNH